jgi:hypothetical protein
MPLYIPFFCFVILVLSSFDSSIFPEFDIIYIQSHLFFRLPVIPRHMALKELLARSFTLLTRSCPQPVIAHSFQLLCLITFASFSCRLCIFWDRLFHLKKVFGM